MSLTAGNIVHIRPRFHLHVDYSIEQLETRIREGLTTGEFPCTGSIKHGFGVINIIKKDQHFWSPQLTVSIEKIEERTEVRGLYGPKPSVWTMFVFFYCVLGFLTLICAMVGFSNLNLDKPAGVLWLSPVFAILFLTIYLVSNFGQKLGREQLVILHNFFEKSVGIKVEDHIAEAD